MNRWRPEQSRLKLLPTQADRASYLACLDATPLAGGADPVGVAYRFFRTQLGSRDDPEDTADIERIENAVISGLALVSVTARRGDNAHRIFESLNNTGMRLTQGHLLRNYLFMKLPKRQNPCGTHGTPAHEALKTSPICHSRKSLRGRSVRRSGRSMTSPALA
jgi:hypothetical protein